MVFTNLESKLHNENIIDYSQILVTGGKFMIFDIEGHPNNFQM